MHAAATALAIKLLASLAILEGQGPGSGHLVEPALLASIVVLSPWPGRTRRPVSQLRQPAERFDQLFLGSAG